MCAYMMCYRYFVCFIVCGLWWYGFVKEKGSHGGLVDVVFIRW